MGTLEGKVAFITGAARGQGRSHALKLASEGADIIAVDILHDLDLVNYPQSNEDDRLETVRGVEALGRKIVFEQADVGDFDQLRRAFESGYDALGRVDIVLANAGVHAVTIGEEEDPVAIFNETLRVNLLGVRNTVKVAVQRMIDQNEGGSIVITSSTQGRSGRGYDGSAAMEGYTASKHGVVGLMRNYANWLAKYNIRVNTIHPTGVDTTFINNDAVMGWINGDASNAGALSNLLDVPVLQPEDISDAVAWIVSPGAKYVTGTTLPVDAGFLVR
ncbi:mycofactocin-coupled SDR family oxidoreductase [Rhodococcus jostii]|uniref:mycofactocin-coupled SDR family oxidoreductase n=1 Tax=Rhodococcus jostii TaxID=132919 RepID=UPI0036533EFD